MKFNNRFTLKNREGEIRVVKKFLWFPRNFEQPKTRWLEYANVKEKVIHNIIYDECSIFESWDWTEIDFDD